MATSETSLRDEWGVARSDFGLADLFGVSFAGRREGPVRIPQVFLCETGAERVVYFPWDIDRTFWEVLSVDHLKLLRNAVLWATNEDPPVSVTGPGVLDVTVWRQRESLTVHLVNLTNPMMMKGPVRELLPVGEQRVRVRLPDGLRAKQLRLLVGGTAPSFRQSGEWLEVAVPSIRAHEVVAVDL